MRQSGESPVLKYGISDELQNGVNRPESQKAALMAKYPGRNVNWKILTRTLNREEALAIEKGLVKYHKEKWGYRPMSKRDPIPQLFKYLK